MRWLRWLLLLGGLDFGGGFSDVVLLREVIVIGVWGEERKVFPGGIANGAEEGSVVVNESGEAREMKYVTAFCSVNGLALTSLHAIQTDFATPLLHTHTKKK